MSRSYARDHYTLCAVSYPATETAECAFLNGFMVLVFFFKNIIAMFAIDIIGIENKIISNASTVRGAVTCSQ